MLHYTAFGDVKKINKKISKKYTTRPRIIEGMTDTTATATATATDTTATDATDATATDARSYQIADSRTYQNTDSRTYQNTDSTSNANAIDQRSMQDIALDCGINPTDVDNFSGDLVPLVNIMKVVNKSDERLEFLEYVRNTMNIGLYGPVVQKCIQNKIFAAQDAADTILAAKATATNTDTTTASDNTTTDTATASASDNTATDTVSDNTDTASASDNTAAKAAPKEATNTVQPYSTDLKTLQIDGNLTMTGQINATSYSNILIAADGKICIGDSCLNKDNIEKLMEMLNK